MRSKLAILSLKISVSAFFVWLLVHNSKLNFNLLPQLLSSPPKLLLILCVYFIVIAISTWRWHKLNEVQNIRLSYSKTLLPTYLGIAFNNLLPGGIGGDFYRFYYLNKAHPAKKSAVTLSIFIDRITGLLGMLIVASVAIAIQASRYSTLIPSNLLMIITLIASGGIIGCLLSYHYLLRNNKFSQWLLTHYHNQRWAQLTLSLINALNIYRQSKKTIIQCLLASVIIQLLITITCILIANLMNYPQISIISYTLAVSLTQIVNLIPIAPGGLGVGEIAFANILTILNPSIAAPYATIFLAYRILGVFTYIPAIGFFMFDREAKKANNAETDVIAI